jgi:processive 1,2-diacylglycerol beta-glucosyltransferase
MEASDLLISKPGGLTVAEALAKELPLGIVNSLAGQERRNRELLLKKGIAFELKDKESMVDLIHKFSNDSFDLKSWRRRVKDLACPKAVLDIAQKIMYLIEEKER